MLQPPQMRAPFKRWFALAGVVIASTTALAWSLSRPNNDTSKSRATNATLSKPSNSPASNRTELSDSDNDGIPDVIELRSFQDRDSFRRWFTTIAETQFYQ